MVRRCGTTVQVLIATSLAAMVLLLLRHPCIQQVEGPAWPQDRPITVAASALLAPAAASLPVSAVTTGSMTVTSAPVAATGSGNRAPVIVLVQRSTVDPERYPERVAGILDTWGSSPLLRLIMLDPAPGVQPVATATGLAPGATLLQPPAKIGNSAADKTEQLLWALQQGFALAPAARWFVKVDDVTMVLPGNLHRYLGSLDSTAPMLLGNRLAEPSGAVFVSGGAGIAFSRPSAELLAAGWAAGCSGLHYLRTAEDVAVTRCLKILGVEPTSSRGTDGGERFGVYGPVRLVTGKVDDWYALFSKNADEPVYSGTRCCAADLCTMHYLEPPLVRFLWSSLTAARNGTHGQLGLADGAALRRNWPNKIGGFDMKPESDAEAALVLELFLKLAGAP